MRLLQRLRIVRPPFLPDPIKAWDVSFAVSLLLDRCHVEDSILDLGCKDSGILPCLAVSGFKSLVGIDVDQTIVRQPRFGCIRWLPADLYRNGFERHSFTAISAISTIEHGLDVEQLAGEISRLLRPGGLWIFSTDYHPVKLDTSWTRPFGMEWTIFSREEIRSLLATFERYDLTPLGGVSLEQHATPIHWMGRRYTFLRGALQKRAR